MGIRCKLMCQLVKIGRNPFQLSHLKLKTNEKNYLYRFFFFFWFPTEVIWLKLIRLEWENGQLIIPLFFYRHSKPIFSPTNFQWKHNTRIERGRKKKRQQIMIIWAFRHSGTPLLNTVVIRYDYIFHPYAFFLSLHFPQSISEQQKMHRMKWNETEP